MSDPMRKEGGSSQPSIMGMLLALIAVAVFVLLSYWRIASPETNDFERLEDVHILVFFLICFLSWCLGYVLLAEALLGSSVSTIPRKLLFVFVGSLSTLLLASFPVGSRDVFAYAFYGKMWVQYGANPYVHAPSHFSSDPWYPLLQAWWKEGPSGYGPLFLLQTRLLYWLAGNHLVANIAAYKVFHLLLLFLGAYLWSAFGPGTDGQNHFRQVRLGLWASSPLILFEGLSSAHNDLAMAVFLLATLFFWVRAKWILFGLFWALSFWYKWYSIVLLPVFAFWSAKRAGISTLWRIVPLAGLGALAATAIALFPFGQQASSILAKPLSIRVGSAIFPTELPPTLWPLFGLFFQSGWFEIPEGRHAFDATRYLIALILLVAILARRWAISYRLEVVAEDCMFVLLVFSGFIVTVLWPWHLLAASSFGLLSHRTGIVWLSIGIMTAGLLSYFLTFSIAVLAVGLAAIVMVFFRSRRTRPPSRE